MINSVSVPACNRRSIAAIPVASKSLAGSLRPIANGFFLFLGRLHLAMNEQVLPVRHFAVQKLVANVFEFLITFLLRVGCPLGKIHQAPPPMNVVGHNP